MREVLGFAAAEAAEILGTTPASVNSALQRARTVVRQRMPGRTQQAELTAVGPSGRRALVDAFVAAWERADVPALLDLLSEDACFTMPPLPACWSPGSPTNCTSWSAPPSSVGAPRPSPGRSRRCGSWRPVAGTARRT
ncbi:sigma factor-like helix-turn-helix DNA-binding protein [Microbispora sp. CA-135349]|uniref:sigma factor-like helix-turn-helix DNA-binding protein n=1 Tax=Microbispora sp. CA-135349 TaxID=3239953 RepID=UPI003D8E320A